MKNYMKLYSLPNITMRSAFILKFCMKNEKEWKEIRASNNWSDGAIFHMLKTLVKHDYLIFKNNKWKTSENGIAIVDSWLEELKG